MDIGLFVGSALLYRGLLSFSSCSSSQSGGSTNLTADVLKKQNAVTSSAIIDHYASSSRKAAFAKLAKYEGDLIIQRDHEDASKLEIGIAFAQNKGVIDPKFVPEPYIPIDVLGKTPDQVAQTVLDHVDKKQASSSGYVIVLVGLSGTGKGTTTSKLRSMLEGKGKVVTTWSNGNVFRCVTLLATTWWEQNNKNVPFNGEKALTKKTLTEFMGMLAFGKHPKTGEFDIHLKGLGLDVYVSDVQNTLLKSPQVSKNIPTVAQYTQGEVIVFAAKAVEFMVKNDARRCVLLEGREQTVNYVRTPHRFCLQLSDDSLIGKRRAAQRLMGQGLQDLQKSRGKTVIEVLNVALESMVKDIN